MKKVIGLMLMLATSASFAMTFYRNGIQYGTVCRDGLYYTEYPAYMAQPVGTACPVRNAYGRIVAYGLVTYE